MSNDTLNGNELAFPFACQGPTTGPEFYYGMTKREYFAAKAMQGLLGDYYARYAKDPDVQSGGGPAAIARAAVVHADALIAELGGEQ
jgi:hypothetical protein